MFCSSKSSLLATALCAAIGLVHAERASAAPDDDKVRAATAFEAGAAAFKAKNYEEAAAQFEAADSAAPAAKSLRLAIRARSEAHDGAQAASLAALALKLYPSDDEVGKLARETIASFGPKLEAIDVSCSSACALATSGHDVHGAARTAWTVYVEPGSVSVTATFGEKPAAAQSVTATSGGSASLKFDLPKKAAPKVDDSSSGSHGSSDGAPSKRETSPNGGNADSSSPSDTSADSMQVKKHWGIHPAVFGVALGLTAVLGATTIWSGVDTQNNPGADAVKKQCAGLGTSCPAYQQGLSSQRRTNILIGVTSGTAALTVVFAIVTNWHGSPKTDDAAPTTDPEKASSAGHSRHASSPHGSSGPIAVSDPRLWIDVESARSPTDVTAPDGAVLGVSGRF